MDGHLDPVGRTLDLHLGHAGGIEPFLERPADLQVLVEQQRVVTLRKPSGIPVLDDPEPQTQRIDFLTHVYPSFSLRTTVMWLVRLWMRAIRPCAR